MNFTRESVEAWERHRAESHAALVLFCEVNGITVERFMASRARAVAAMRAPSTDGCTRHVVSDDGRPRVRLQTFDEFIARFSDDELRRAIVDLVIDQRRRRANQQWLRAELPPGSDIEAAIAEHMDSLAVLESNWRAELA